MPVQIRSYYKCPNIGRRSIRVRGSSLREALDNAKKLFTPHSTLPRRYDDKSIYPDGVPGYIIRGCTPEGFKLTARRRRRSSRSKRSRR